VGIRCAHRVTPLYPQKLALTSPTGGGRSVGIVRSRTKAMEFMEITGIEILQQQSHFITMNKKPTRRTIVLKSLKLYCILIPLYMFRALLRPSSGAS
jgi:hypothetical protein